MTPLRIANTFAVVACMAFGSPLQAMAQLPDAVDKDAGQTTLPTVIVRKLDLDKTWAYRSMAVGLDVFDRRQAALAPGAALRFVVRDFKDARVAGGAVVKVLGEETNLSIPIDADGGFVLPRSKSAYADRADVMLVVEGAAAQSRERGDYFSYPEPEVRSPHLPAGTWRMGDLRLMCYMNLAMYKDTQSFLMGMTVRLALMGEGDFCSRSRDPKVMTHIGFTAPAPFDSATLIDGERRQVIGRGRDKRVLKVPVSGDWPDDTLIVFQFSGEGTRATSP